MLSENRKIFKELDEADTKLRKEFKFGGEESVNAYNKATGSKETYNNRNGYSPDYVVFHETELNKRLREKYKEKFERSRALTDAMTSRISSSFGDKVSPTGVTYKELVNYLINYESERRA